MSESLDKKILTYNHGRGAIERIPRVDDATFLNLPKIVTQL